MIELFMADWIPRAKQFLAAAQEAGIDLTDEDALAAFGAGWNEQRETA